MKRTELTAKRNGNTKFFENQDHSTTAEIYLDQVHYQDKDGSWKDMDDSLFEESLEENEAQSISETKDEQDKKPKDFTNQKGDFNIRFKNQTNQQGTVAMTKGDAKLTWAIEGCSKVKVQKTEKNQVRYNEIMKSTDLVCGVHGERVKEDLILRGPEAPASFTYIYKMKNLEPEQNGRCVSFINPEGEEVFSVCAPYMKDASGEKSEEIALTLEKDKKGTVKVTFTPDRSWLDNSERSYPVVIDPVTTTSKKAADIEDASVSSLYEEDNFYNNILLKTMGGNEIWRSFLKFELPEINTGDMVVGARLVLVSLAEDQKERTVQVHKVLQTWDANTVNWYNKPIYEETVEDLCKYKGDKQKYITLDITRMVKDWYTNGSNNGLMLKDPYELSGYTEFLSSDCDNGYQDMRPRIEISYVNYSGIEDYWSYHSQDIGRAGTACVNDYNGNLILTHETLTMSGSRMPVSLSHVYNTNNRTENIGYGNGFRLSYHQTLKKVTIAGTEYYKHVDGDGTVHYFYYDSTKKEWLEESGLDLKLTVNTGAAEPYIIKDKEENCLVFNANGYLIKVRDNNSNTLTIGYANNRITKLTDGVGRVTTLLYSKDSAGKAADLIEMTPPSGKKKLFTYASGNLVSIKDMDGETITYAYNSNHMLTEAANIDGYKVKYTYYTTKPYRVKSITEYAGTVKGGSLNLTYGYNSTKFTDNKGRSEIFRFDNKGNLLHIHDGFGHAASGKYSKESNYTNRLENATSLQANVVQLLKDPIIQAAKCGWSSKVSPAGAGRTDIDKSGKNSKVGNQSLIAEGTTLTGYAYWAQNVTVKKGGTYTASMYVKATVKQTAEDGGAILRIAYQDKDGNQQLLDSEVLKKTTTDFVRLTNTFTLPEDASSAVVKVYMVMWHAIGLMYGDMAQLEAGDTPSRVNLVDNGDFHLGTISGFTKSGRAFDKITSVGTNEFIPVQSALTVTAASAIIRYTASTTGTTVATVTKNTHLAGLLTVTNEDKTWYRVRTSDGKLGYILNTQAVPYLGGSQGVNSAAVGVTGAILRSTASPTGTPVEEYIPKWTSLAVANTKTGTDGKKWYYVGMQIDKTRYFGYLPQHQVVSLCRNAARGKTKTAAKLYEDMSTKSTLVKEIAINKNVNIRGTATDSGGKLWYVVRLNEKLLYLPSEQLQIDVAPIVERIKTYKVTETIGGLDKNIFRFVGEPGMNKKLTKTLDIKGKGGDTFMVNAWGCGTPLPETDNDKARRFGVEVIFVGTEGAEDVHYTNFSPDILDWQFLSDVYVAKDDYTSIKVSYTYCHNANMAFFDGLSLYREEYGQSYTYDSKNNLISVTDAQKQAVKFEYNTKNDMTGVIDAKGNKFKYEYDTKHNVTKGTSAQGVVYKLTYDNAGNVLKSGCVDPANEAVGTWITRTMTNNQNHVRTVTDAGNNTIQYYWNHDKDQLVYMLDSKGSKISYTYDESERLAGVSQNVTIDGTLQTVTNAYAYTKDRLTSIGHNGFNYEFAYDNFGNMLNASVAGTQVVGYEYEPNNGNLLKVLYGNGCYIRYTYDQQDRMLLSFYKDPSGDDEQKLNEYIYDREGNLYQVISHMSGKTYFLSYDLLDRLMRVTDEQGNSYTYTYDVSNNMVQMNHTCGTSSADTSYTYDKDGREVTTKCATSYTRTTSYDKFGRPAKLSWNTPAVFNTTYTYFDVGTNNRYSLPKTVKNGNDTLEYAYDANGNITSIKDGAGESTFMYDELNQLIRENNHVLGKTITYAYDLGGNLVTVKEFAYTTADTLPASAVRTEAGVYDTVWKDKLLNWNGMEMTYDAIGNMLTKGDTSFTWTLGRKLSGVNNGKSIQYYYDHNGARTKKVVDGVATEYRMAGDLLVSEKTGTQTYWYRYDSEANLVSVTIQGKIYFYVRNAQNDVIALVDADGNVVVKYTYDSWGKVVSITGSLADTIGVQNPFRYRGYYYDNETGMYYLRTRYYDPEIRRFIIADGQVNDTVLGNNVFSYCENNPIHMADPSGSVAISSIFAGGALIISLIGGFFISRSPSVKRASNNFGNSISNYIARPRTSILNRIYNNPANYRDEAKRKIDASIAKVKVTPWYKGQTQEHHIVAKRHKVAEPARKVLKGVGIGLDDPINKIRLKRGLHQHLHNTLYMKWINNEMEKASKYGRLSVETELDTIRLILEAWNYNSLY